MSELSRILLMVDVGVAVAAVTLAGFDDVNRRFDSVNRRLDKLRNDTDARFDALEHRLLAGR